MPRNLRIEMKSGIYKLYWNNCRYYYIGQSVHVGNRLRGHINSLKIRTHRNTRMQRVFNKYGEPKLIVLEYCPITKIDKIEQRYLNKHFKDKNCINLAPFVKSSCGRKITASLRKKLSDARKYLSVESRRNISLGQMGKTNSKESNEKRRQTMLNIGQEYRDNMRKIKLGTYTGKQNHASKLTIDLVSCRIYDTAKEACKQTPYNYFYFKSMLSGNCRNKTQFEYLPI